MATIASEPSSKGSSQNIYSHDGLHDSFTHLAAPTALYEHLRRELARAKREHRLISIVRFVLTPKPPTPEFVEPIPSSRYEGEILVFAQMLTRQSRDEEICARVGELEFICIIHGVADAAQSFIARINENYLPDLAGANIPTSAPLLLLESAWLIAYPDESALELLNRVDSQVDPH